MVVGVRWMPFSCSLLRLWAVDSRSGKTFSIMVYSSLRSSENMDSNMAEYVLMVPIIRPTYGERIV
ncbi:hypothetical protein GW17_00053290 [Ensete ventricosum]|nr:hypothetical protein GW17_00053290 [Ensete ventricosum]